MTGVVNGNPPAGTNPYNNALTMAYVFTGCVSGRVNANGVPCVTIAGVVNALHRNPDHRMPNVVGDISYPGGGAGQAFVATAIGAGCVWVPAGNATIAAPGNNGLLFKYDRPAGAAFQPYVWCG